MNLSYSLFLTYSYYYHFLNRAKKRKMSHIKVVRVEQEGSLYNFGDDKKFNLLKCKEKNSRGRFSQVD